MQVTNSTQARERMQELRKQMEDLNRQLGAMRVTSSSGEKDAAGIVTTMLQAEKELAGQMMDMEKELAIAAIQSPPALDGNGKAQLTGAKGGGAMAGSQDPVMDNLQITRNGLEQEFAAEKAAGNVSTPKTVDLMARLKEVDIQIDELKAQRVAQAKGVAEQSASTSSSNDPTLTVVKTFPLRNASAGEVVLTMNSMFAGPATHFTNDGRTNAVIAKAPQKAMASIIELIQQLDVAPPEKAKGPNAVGADFDVRELIGVTKGTFTALTADQRAAAQELQSTLSKMTSPDSEISTFNGTLVFRGSDRDLDTIANFIERLRARHEEEMKRQAEQAK